MTTIIIPARMGSTRLPRKPLANINGKQLIKRVHTQCEKASVGPVYVASDDQLVFDCIHDVFDMIGVMTASTCISGTDRVAEAAMLLELPDDEIVINVQGDMPYIPVRMIHDFADFMKNREMGTIVIPLSTPVCNDCVSVVLNHKQQVMYFSRANIPSGNGSVHYQHVGMYGYRADVLKKIASYGQSRLEKAESLEQLRVIENDICRIDVMLSVLDPGPEVNTPEDLIKINKEK